MLTASDTEAPGAAVQVTLRIHDDSVEDEARSLHDWFQADRALRRSSRIEMLSSKKPVAGAQGTVLDLVSLVFSSGFSAASLGISVASWRATRPQQPTVTLERPDGRTVTISGTSASETQRMVEQLFGED
ncbi:effector-associated constant component EACC1 [Streptomyces niveus]|uniref:effector-associated constant component EACC1 n=1 Tax=Streptomyces niveus TaxID=193462 RepID=UPI0033ED4D11